MNPGLVYVIEVLEDLTGNKWVADIAGIFCVNTWLVSKGFARILYSPISGVWSTALGISSAEEWLVLDFYDDESVRCALRRF